MLVARLRSADLEFHGTPVDVRDRTAWPRLYQRAQPYCGRENPLRRFGLAAGRLGLKRPKHRPIATVGADSELDTPQLVAGVTQLAQGLDCRPTFAHALESLAAEVEFAGGLMARPIYSDAGEIFFEQRY